MFVSKVISITVFIGTVISHPVAEPSTIALFIAYVVVVVVTWSALLHLLLFA